MASDFGTPRSHEIKDESGVISKGWCVRGALSSGFIHQLIPLDMMMVDGSGLLRHLDSLMVTLDLMSDIYIRC